VSVDIAAIVDRARLTAERPSGAPDGAGTARQRLERVAQEFESMLLAQMLRNMRTAGQWEDDSGGDTLGAETMFETIDVELASHLARVKGLGLSKEMLVAFDRMNPVETRGPGIGDQGLGIGETARALAAVAPAASAIAPIPDPGSPIPDPRSPVPGDVTSDFGWRRDPFTGQAKFHRGVDLRAAYGQDVHAAGDGRVVFSGNQGGYGTTVLIEHADGTRTRYAHLSVALVASGEAVAGGQSVGQAGRSGRATGTHLHFEVIGVDGRPVNPRMAGHVGSSALNGD
jgi:murein DD-endopeptidase MepM/ murein hydrolase activator NlpD